jgi:hypothetical protein
MVGRFNDWAEEEKPKFCNQSLLSLAQWLVQTRPTQSDAALQFPLASTSHFAEISVCETSY